MSVMRREGNFLDGRTLRVIGHFDTTALGIKFAPSNNFWAYHPSEKLLFEQVRILTTRATASNELGRASERTTFSSEVLPYRTSQL